LKHLKKNLSIFIILVYIANIMVYTVVYSQLKIHVKKEAINKIRSEKFKKAEIIKISKREVEKKSVSFRMLEKHEFLYEGKMYDIISISEDKENMIFYCIHDEKEEKLDLAFQKHVENNSAKRFSNCPDKKIVDVGFISLIKIRIKVHSLFNVQNDGFNNYQNIISNIITPPPQPTYLK